MPEPRGNGVTILIGRQLLLTQPPIKEDHVFVATVTQWVTDYYKGNPQQ